MSALVDAETAGSPDVVRQVILKLHSRCNLSCTYCYVYSSVDLGWRRQPKTMSQPTLDSVAARLVEHVDKHSLSEISVVLHGGEPLQAGHDAVENALATIAARVPAQFSIQTNGVLLDERFLGIFHRYDVMVGVSLDGNEWANRHRTYANGQDSYAKVLAGLALLTNRAHRDRFGGLLCTIDVRNDPMEVYAALAAFRPPVIDLLLPHGNWTNPPPRPVGAMSYSSWLIAAFDAWYSAAQVDVAIRFFQSIIVRLLGGFSDTEAIGGDVPGVVTVETDGSYEQSDALKTTVDGGAATGLSLAESNLDDVLRRLAVAAAPTPAAECRSGPIGVVCGGGLRAHRFRADNQFANPSVYCADLFALISHIRDRVRQDVAHR